MPFLVKELAAKAKYIKGCSETHEILETLSNWKHIKKRGDRMRRIFHCFGLSLRYQKADKFALGMWNGCILIKKKYV